MIVDLCLKNIASFPGYGRGHGQLVNTTQHVTLLGWFLTGQYKQKKNETFIDAYENNKKEN